MKLLLCIALLFLAVQLSESYCDTRLKNEAGNCIDPHDGTMYSVGESWIDASCMRCSCGADSIHCCQEYSTPVGYSEDCVAVFNPLACRYRVYRRDNPSIECHTSGLIGK